MFHSHHENPVNHNLDQFVGYASNSHTYCILNKSTGCIEETADVECDENNGFHAKQIVSSVVGDEAPSQATSSMGIGHILPQETPRVHVERRRSKSPSCGSTTREVITPNTRARCYGRSCTYPRTRSSSSVFPELDQGPLEPMLSR